MAKYLISTLCLLYKVALQAQLDTMVVRDLSSAWVKWDKKGELVWVQDIEKPETAGLFLLKHETKDRFLNICGENLDFWINGRLINSQISGCIDFDLNKYTSRHPEDTLFLVFSSDSFLKTRVKLKGLSEQPPKHLQLPKRRQSSGNDFEILSLLLTLLFLSALKLNGEPPSTLLRFSFLSANYDKEAQASLPSLLLTSLFATFLLTLDYLLATGQPIYARFFFGSFGVAALIIWTRYLLIQTVSRLFNFKKAGLLQFKSFVFLFAAMHLWVFGIQAVLIWLGITPQLTIDSVRHVPVAIGLIHAFWIYSVFMKKITRQKLHVIAYLCTTEIFQTFILAKWLLV